jgi:hypothetical protein
VASLIEAMSVSGAMLLAAVALLVWMRMAVALRPRWRREKELHEHRKKGVPCGGPATIVVTDIEAYSGGAARYELVVGEVTRNRWRLGC